MYLCYIVIRCLSEYLQKVIFPLLLYFLQQFLKYFSIRIVHFNSHIFIKLFFSEDLCEIFSLNIMVLIQLSYFFIILLCKLVLFSYLLFSMKQSRYFKYLNWYYYSYLWINKLYIVVNNYFYYFSFIKNE